MKCWVPSLTGARAEAGDEVRRVRDVGGSRRGAAGREHAVDVDAQIGSFAREAEQVERPVVHRRRGRPRVVVGRARVLVELDVHGAAGVDPVVPEAAVHANRPLTEHPLDLSRVEGADPIAHREVGGAEVARGVAEGDQVVDAVEAEALAEPAGSEGGAVHRAVGCPHAVLGVAFGRPVVDEIGFRDRANHGGVRCRGRAHRDAEREHPQSVAATHRRPLR